MEMCKGNHHNQASLNWGVNWRCKGQQA